LKKEIRSLNPSDFQIRRAMRTNKNNSVIRGITDEKPILFAVCKVLVHSGSKTSKYAAPLINPTKNNSIRRTSILLLSIYLNTSVLKI
jgi:hypothetical protein